MPTPPVPPGIRAALARVASTRDAAAAVTYAAVCLVCVLAVPATAGLLAEHPWPAPVSMTLLLLACAAVLARRRAPVLVLVVTGGLSLAEILGGGQVGAYLLLFEALWVPVVHGSARLARAATASGGAAGAALLVIVTAWIPGVTGLVTALLLVSIVIATPLLWGWEVRRHREARRTAEALARAERELATERAGRAVDVERRRIAQDLHDVVAGHLSAVALHAALASTLEDPAARRASLETTRDAATAALRDLRSVIEVLTGPDPAGPAETTLSWEAIGARLRTGTGTDASVVIDPRIEDPATVDAAVRAAMLRIGAESVTNAMRHGCGPRRLEVALENDPDRSGDGAVVALSCTNSVPPDSVTGRGMGRAALADRARAVGGTARSAPDGPGAWRVTARIPARGTPRSQEET